MVSAELQPWSAIVWMKAFSVAEQLVFRGGIKGFPSATYL
jgi:hypothetical protein